MKIFLVFLLALLSNAAYASGADVPAELYFFLAVILIFGLFYLASYFDKAVKKNKNKSKDGDDKQQ